jgi:uncharacterized protein
LFGQDDRRVVAPYGLDASSPEGKVMSTIHASSLAVSTADRAATHRGEGHDGHDSFETLTGQECRLLLSLTTVGRIGFMADDYPVVLPVTYRLFDDDAGIMVVLRTRPGHSIDRAPLRVALEIDGLDHQHHEGWSVLVRGRLHHIDEDAAVRLADVFEPDPWPHELRTSWLVISAEVISGRRLYNAEAEWPFSASAYR